MRWRFGMTVSDTLKLSFVPNSWKKFELQVLFSEWICTCTLTNAWLCKIVNRIMWHILICETVMVISYKAVITGKTFWLYEIPMSVSCHVYTHTHIHTYTGCHRRNGPNFGRVFRMLNYTDITQNTYVPIERLLRYWPNKIVDFLRVHER